MKDLETMRKFLDEYREYVVRVLEPTQQEIKSIFSRWKEPGYWGKYAKRSKLPDPSPAQRVHTRIKRPESMMDKILRKPSSFPTGLVPESFQKMNDAVGVRVIVYFLSQLPLIDLELRNSDFFEISRDAPPIAYLGESITKRLALIGLKREDKDSGYASIHYILRLRDSVVPLNNRPWFELQVRTLVEDIWGEIEHILGYKPNKRTSFAVRKQFQIISSELMAIDEHFNFLYEELSRFQEEGTYKDSDPLNAENLPSVLDDVGLGCAQREIDGLLKLLASRGVQKAGSFLFLATPKRLETIKNTYRSELGTPPTNFEIVANLANLVGCSQEDEEIGRIKAQIAFLQVWDELKQRSSSDP